MRVLWTAAAYLGVLWGTAIACVFGILSFVGPHSAPQPEAVVVLVYLLAGAAVLVLPVLAAARVWRGHGETRAE